MRFRHRQEYDATPADVHAMFADQAFREKVCRAQKATTASVNIEPDGDAMSVMVDQTRPAEGIPGYARRIVGDDIRILQVERWSGASGAALEVTIPGKPGELKGTITVAGGDQHTVKTVDGDLKVPVPLLGARLEGLVAGLLTQALDTEQKVARAWLAGER